MAVIESDTDISAPVGQVWKIVSNLDAEPKYWKGTKSVRNLPEEGGKVRREVVIAFRDKVCGQSVEIDEGSEIRITFTSGVILGTKIITLGERGSGTNLKVVWDIKLQGMLGMFTGMLKKHIRGGTEQALYAIKKDAESCSS